MLCDCCFADRGRLYMFGDGRHGKLALGDENFANQFKPCPVYRFQTFFVESVSLCGLLCSWQTVTFGNRKKRNYLSVLCYILLLSRVISLICKLWCSGVMWGLSHIGVRAQVARERRCSSRLRVGRRSSRQQNRRTTDRKVRPRPQITFKSLTHACTTVLTCFSYRSLWKQINAFDQSSTCGSVWPVRKRTGK